MPVAFTILQQIRWRGVPRKGFPQLLGSPLRAVSVGETAGERRSVENGSIPDAPAQHFKVYAASWFRVTHFVTLRHAADKVSAIHKLAAGPANPLLRGRPGLIERN
jgi:hypothetical protein